MNKIFTFVAASMLLLGGASASAAFPNILEPTNITPASGGTLDIGGQVEITFDYGGQDTQMSLVSGGAAKIVFTDSEGTVYSPADFIDYAHYPKDCFQLLIPFNPDNAGSGEWTLTVPEGVLVTGGLGNVAITANYTVGGSSQGGDTDTPVEISVFSTDYQGEVVSQIADFNICVSPKSAVLSDDAAEKLYILSEDFTTYVSVSVEKLFDMWDGSGSIYAIHPSYTIEKANTWYFCVDEGAFQVPGGLANEAFEHKWVIEGSGTTYPDEPEQPEYAGYFDYTSVNPSDAEPLTFKEGETWSDVKFFLPAGCTVNNEVAMDVTLSSGARAASIPCTVRVNDLGSYGCFGIIEFNVQESGSYLLTVPVGTFVNAETNEANNEWVLNYSVEFEAPAAAVELVSITPEDGAYLDGFTANVSTVTAEFANLNMADVYQLEFEVYNGSGEYAFSGYAYPPAEGNVFTWTAPTDYPLYEGHTYIASFILYSTNHDKLCEFSVTWTGTAVEQQTVSEVQIVSVTPDPLTAGRIQGSQNEFVITFDNPVSFNASASMVSAGGQGAATAKLNAVSEDDNKVWTLTVPASMMNNPEINFILFFQDMDGLYVSTDLDTQNIGQYFMNISGNMEQGFFLRYDVAAGVAATIEPAAGTIAVLEAITASYNSMPFRWANIMQPSEIVVKNEAGEVVATGNEAIDENSVESGLTSNYCTVTFSPAVTEAGTYTVEIPFGAFSIGEEGNAETYAGQTVTYTVDGSAVALDSLTVDSAAEAGYFTLQGIRVAKPAAGNVYIRVVGDKASKVRF